MVWRENVWGQGAAQVPTSFSIGLRSMQFADLDATRPCRSHKHAPDGFAKNVPDFQTPAAAPNCLTRRFMWLWSGFSSIRASPHGLQNTGSDAYKVRVDFNRRRKLCWDDRDRSPSHVPPIVVGENLFRPHHMTTTTRSRVAVKPKRESATPSFSRCRHVCNISIASGFGL